MTSGRSSRPGRVWRPCWVRCFPPTNVASWAPSRPAAPLRPRRSSSGWTAAKGQLRRGRQIRGVFVHARSDLGPERHHRLHGGEEGARRFSPHGRRGPDRVAGQTGVRPAAEVLQAAPRPGNRKDVTTRHSSRPSVRSWEAAPHRRPSRGRVRGGREVLWPGPNDSTLSRIPGVARAQPGIGRAARAEPDDGRQVGGPAVCGPRARFSPRLRRSPDRAPAWARRG